MTKEPAYLIILLYLVSLIGFSICLRGPFFDEIKRYFVPIRFVWIQKRIKKKLLNSVDNGDDSIISFM